jgi:thiol:disulfide interchange protein DsbD
MRRFQLIFGLISAFAVAPLACAASNSADVAHLHVQLVFPNQNINAGTPENAGLYFKLESGWHVYWKNAGDSGEPPRIQWTMPTGITASAIQFPAPKRLPLGPLMDFGYENEVLFPFTVQAAATAKTGAAILQAKVDWLVCREVCIPGKAELDQNVNLISGTPVVNLISPGDQQLWERLANQLPQALPSSDTAIFQSTPTGFRLASLPANAKPMRSFFPKTRTSSTIPRRKPFRRQRRASFSISRRMRTSPQTPRS